MRVEPPIPTRPSLPLPLVACSGSMQSRQQRRIGREPKARNAEEHRRSWEVPRGAGGARVRACGRPPPAYVLITGLARSGRIRLTARARQGGGVSCGQNSNAAGPRERGDWAVQRHPPARAASTGRRRRSGAARGAERGRLGQARWGASGRDERERALASWPCYFYCGDPGCGAGGGVGGDGGSRGERARGHAATARGRLFASEQTERSKHRTGTPAVGSGMWHPVRGPHGGTERQ